MREIIQILQDASIEDPTGSSYEQRIIRDSDFEKVAEAIQAFLQSAERYQRPVLNGRGRDIRRKYFFRYEVGGVERVEEFIAPFLNDAYKLFEEKTGKPEPQITAVWSEPIAEQRTEP